MSESADFPSIPGYEVLAELGRGNMGVVYKARQKSLGRLVALKTIRAGDRAGQEALQRFVTEARLVASLQHPNIVQLYEINLDQDPPYFTMELVEGGTLGSRVFGCPQPLRQAAGLVHTLARAIHVAHQAGIVHRDLKPSNILLAPVEGGPSTVQRMIQELGVESADLPLGMPKITDFGLAKQMQAEVGWTESGMILGTPGYMAPEQAEGKARDVGPAADVYALGVILYELLTGRPPFSAESPLETFLLLFQAEPLAPSRLRARLPRDLETICLKCLHKEPHRRYGSAEALAEDLRRFLAGEPILARPPSPAERAWKWSRRRPALATLLASTALAAVALLGMLVWHQVDLRAQLGEALENEREAREAQDAADERQRRAQVDARVQELLRGGEAAIAARDWRKAQVQLSRARDQAGDSPELAALRGRIEDLLRQTRQQHHDHERLDHFRRCRNDALFQATLYTGSDRASALRKTRSAALEALAQFGVTPGSSAAPSINSPFFSTRQRAEIVACCCELLIVLAEATAAPLHGQSAAERRRQAEEALRILDDAGRLGVATQAYHRRRAHYLAQAGQNASAQEETRRAQALRPSTPLDHFLLGQEYYRQGKYTQAVPAFENALQQQPDHFWAACYLALCRLKTGRPEQAAARLTACLGQRRDFPWLYLLRASAWAEMRQFPRAEEDFQAALQTSLPESAHYGLLINRGVMRVRQGQVDRAVADLRQAIDLRPHFSQGYVNLAQAYLKGRQLDKAIEALDLALCREPGMPSLYRTRARLHLLRQDEDKALADLDGVLQLATDAEPAARADDHLERGRLLHRRKDYRQAVQACDAALRLVPVRGLHRDVAARAWRLRAEALLELDRPGEALRSLDDSLKANPADAGALRARAALRTRLGQYAGAQTDYTRALELEPNAATYAARGWCFLVADAPRLALPDFEEALRLDPETGDAHAGRGYARIRQGDLRGAVADADEALRRGPRSSRLYYNVARIYAQAAARQRGDWQERARQALTGCLDLLSPREAARFWHRVVLPDKALYPIRASRWFRQLAARYPRL